MKNEKLKIAVAAEKFADKRNQKSFLIFHF